MECHAAKLAGAVELFVLRCHDGLQFDGSGCKAGATANVRVLVVQECVASFRRADVPKLIGDVAPSKAVKLPKIIGINPARCGQNRNRLGTISVDDFKLGGAWVCHISSPVRWENRLTSYARN
jgi:hypothetical protein